MGIFKLFPQSYYNITFINITNITPKFMINFQGYVLQQEGRATYGLLELKSSQLRLI